MSDVATLDAHRTGEMVQPTLFEGVEVAYTEVKCKTFKVDTPDDDTRRMGETRRIMVEVEVIHVGHRPLDKDDPKGTRVREETVRVVSGGATLG